MTVEPGAWDAYVGAVIRIEAPDGVFWIRPAPPGHTTGPYPDPQGHPIYVLTAHNPGGQVASPAANAAAEVRLKEKLEGLTWCPGDGGDPTWTHVEPGAALTGIDQAEAIALGAEFKQEAIFVLTPDSRQVVACTDARVTTTGWTSERG